MEGRRAVEEVYSYSAAEVAALKAEVAQLRAETADKIREDMARRSARPPVPRERKTSGRRPRSGHSTMTSESGPAGLPETTGTSCTVS